MKVSTPQTQMPEKGTNFRIWNFRCLLRSDVKQTYDSNVEAIQNRADVVKFSQGETGNCEIRVGLKVGGSIVLEPRAKRTVDSKPAADWRSRQGRNVCQETQTRLTCHTEQPGYEHGTVEK
jgi:hypothetical protein